MSAWGDSQFLMEQLDRHFGFLERLRSTAKVVRLHRIMAFVEGEPILAGVLQDARIEADETERELHSMAAAIRAKLGELWSSNSSWIRRHAETSDDDGDADGFELRMYANVETYEEKLRECPMFNLLADDGDRENTSKLIAAFRQWRARAEEANQHDLPRAPERAELNTKLDALWQLARHLERRVRDARRMLAWPAYKRLSEKVDALNPAPPPLDREWTPQEWVALVMDEERATALQQSEQPNAELNRPGFPGGS